MPGRSTTCIAMATWLRRPTKELVRTSIQNRASGIRLDTSGTFRQLLPRTRHANFSALIYQNAQEALKMLSNLAPEEQAQARQLAEKIGPTLIAAYAQADRIQVTTYGSSMDLLMQTALAPMFHGGAGVGKNVEQRGRWLRIANTWRQSSN